MFRKPMIKESFDFIQCFYCSAGEESVMDFVKNLSHAREQMKDALASAHLNSTSCLEAIDAYIPLLWRLLASLDGQDPVKVESPLRFVWRGSVIHGNPKLDSLTYADVIFELIMSLHSKGVVTANLAAEIAESDASSVNKAAACLREASAIMKYLASNLIPRWKTRSNYRYCPPETDSLYCDYLAEYLMASSNQMCAAKALQGSAPVGLLASLCLTVTRSMESCLKALSVSGLSIKDLDPGSRNHAGIMREFFSALVYRYQAETYMAKNETGIVIALCAVIQNRINSCSKSKAYDPFKPAEFPKTSQQSSSLQSALSELAEYIAQLRKTAEEENRLVYFKTIPRDTADLPELPAPAALNLPCPPYEPPTSDIVRFSYDPSRKPTVFGAFSKMFSRKSNPSEQSKSTSENNIDEKADQNSPLEDDNNAADAPVLTKTSSSQSTDDSALVDENSVQRLVNMGFDAEISRNSLLKHNGNETAAINDLLSS